jgi:hypothetical protein
MTRKNGDSARYRKDFEITIAIIFIEFGCCPKPLAFDTLTDDRKMGTDISIDQFIFVAFQKSVTYSG